MSGEISYFDLLEKFSNKPIIIVEENSRRGGLASSILESLVGADINLSKFTSLATNDDLIHSLGSQSFLRKVHGIDSTAIENAFFHRR